MIRAEIGATKDRIRDISYQLEHPPENPNVAIDYDRIKAMISAIEKEQNEYCKLKEQYLGKYRAEDIAVRSLEHQTAIARELQEAHLEKVNGLR